MIYLFRMEPNHLDLTMGYLIQCLSVMRQAKNF